MKIIHFTPYYPPDRLGGVGEVVAALHQALRDEGHTSTVVTRGVRAQPGVERIARGPLAWFLKTALWAGRAAQYDVVHCQGGEALPVLLMLALRRRRPPILSTFHVSFTGISAAFSPYTIAGRTFGRGLRPLLYRTVVSSLHRLLDATTIRLSDAVNTISLQSARDVLGEDRQQDALVVYYGLPELPASAEDDPSLEPTELLYVGSGGPRKRIVALPFVLAHVHREIPGVRMRIIGFPPESEPEVVALFQEHGLLGYVDFVGVKRSDELPPYYARAEVLVVPSAYEGLPCVILEAMRSALPVVATRVSGHPEAIVDGENGFLVDLDRPKQMAERCVRILQDRALRQRLGEAARRTIEERFTVKRQVREYLGIYERLSRTRKGLANATAVGSP